MSDTNKKQYCHIFSVDSSYFQKYIDEKKNKNGEIEQNEKYKLVLPTISNVNKELNPKEVENKKIKKEIEKEYKKTNEGIKWREKNILNENEIKILASGGIVYRDFVTQQREKTYQAYIKWNNETKKIEQVYRDDFIGTLSNSLDLKEMRDISNKHIFMEKYRFNPKKAATHNCLGSTIMVINVDLSKDIKLRNNLYENGFDFEYDKKSYHYVRYKRTASSARNGRCLFIIDKYLKEMNKWSFCGLSEPEAADTKWEAYISLSLSGILEKTITLRKNEILITKDRISTFTAPKDSIIVRYDKSNKDFIAQDPCENDIIENNIWDGESLIDDSMFVGEYEEAHMLLLRARFLKTCAFRTRLQKWFEDNGIKSDMKAKDVLKGFTLDDDAKVGDIKLVITESSLKYLKFANKKDPFETQVRNWFENARTKDNEIEFGVVKTDPKLSGKVRMSYQLLQTLGLKDSEINELITKHNDIFQRSYNDKYDFLNFLSEQENSHLNDDASEDDSDDVSEGDNNSELENSENDKSEDSNYVFKEYQNIAIANLIKCVKKIETESQKYDLNKLPYYRNIIDSRMESYKNRIREGHIPINGIYGTLFGNPAEFLYSLIYDYNPNESKKLEYGKEGMKIEIATLKPECIYSNYFEKGEDVLSVRFPHITMGNIFVPQNKETFITDTEDISFYDKYFDLGKSIVCINSIGSTVLQRLNGADFDSDTMLMTNDPIFVNAANRLKFSNDYKVPINMVKEIEQGDENAKRLKDIDHSICKNKLGEIVNLASFMNGEYWNTHYIDDNNTVKGRGSSDEYDMEWKDGNYKTLCILEVLSNLEVDKAKKNYPDSNIDIYKREYMDNLRYGIIDCSLNLEERKRIVDRVKDITNDESFVTELKDTLKRSYIDYYLIHDSDEYEPDMNLIIKEDLKSVDAETVQLIKDKYRDYTIVNVKKLIPEYYTKMIHRKYTPRYSYYQKVKDQDQYNYYLNINILLFWVALTQSAINIEDVVKYEVLTNVVKICSDENKEYYKNIIKEIDSKGEIEKLLNDKGKNKKAMKILANADYADYIGYYCYSLQQISKYIKNLQNKLKEAEKPALILNNVNYSLFNNDLSCSVSSMPIMTDDNDNSFMGQLHRVFSQKGNDYLDINKIKGHDSEIKDLCEIWEKIDIVKEESEKRRNKIINDKAAIYKDLEELPGYESRLLTEYEIDKLQSPYEGDSTLTKQKDIWESGIKDWEHKNRQTGNIEIKAFRELYKKIVPTENETIESVKHQIQKNKLIESLLTISQKAAEYIKLNNTFNSKDGDDIVDDELDIYELRECLKRFSKWEQKIIIDTDEQIKAVLYILQYIDSSVVENKIKNTERELQKGKYINISESRIDTLYNQKISIITTGLLSFIDIK